jgi:hypothetical protein
MISFFELVFLYYTPARGYSSHLLVMSMNRLSRGKKYLFKQKKTQSTAPMLRGNTAGEASLYQTV